MKITRYLISNISMSTLKYKNYSIKDFIIIEDKEYDAIAIENIVSQKLAHVTKLIDDTQIQKNKKKKSVDTDNI